MVHKLWLSRYTVWILLLGQMSVVPTSTISSLSIRSLSTIFYCCRSCLMKIQDDMWLWAVKKEHQGEFYFRWCLLGTSFKIYLFSWDLLLLASIGTRNGEPLTHVQMCNLLVNSYGALTELTSHVSLRAILLQVLVEEPLLKLCSTTTRAWDRQVFAVFIVRLYRKSRRI